MKQDDKRIDVHKPREGTVPKSEANKRARVIQLGEVVPWGYIN